MRIEVLFPEICNLYGELANPRYLARSCGAELTATVLTERPRFPGGGVDLLYMGSTTERGQVLAREALLPWREALLERTEAGGVTLFTGNALEVLGRAITDEEGKTEPMLGLLPLEAQRSFLRRYNAIYLGRFGDLAVVGHKAQFGHAWPVWGENPFREAVFGLFDTVRGAGLNPGERWEGMRVRNLFATYLLGPLLVLNPPFTKVLMTLLGVPDPHPAFEGAAMEAYEARVREYGEPGRGVVY